MTYAYNSDKDLVFIDTVPNGKNCNCTCPECGEALIARNEGKKNEHHFAHINGTECELGFQTMVHLLAKEIFIESKHIPIPVLFNGKSYLKDYTVSKAIEELNFGDFQPDIVLNCDGVLFFIEIYVTHAVTEEKKAILISKPVTTIEYDLSKIDRHITKEDLKKFLFSTPKIRFYYNYDSSRIEKKASYIKENGFKIITDASNRIHNCPKAFFRNTKTNQSEQCIIHSEICKKCNYFSGYFVENDIVTGYCGGNIEDKQSLDLRVFNGLLKVQTNSEFLDHENQFKKELLSNANKNAVSSKSRIKIITPRKL